MGSSSTEVTLSITVFAPRLDADSQLIVTDPASCASLLTVTGVANLTYVPSVGAPFAPQLDTKTGTGQTCYTASSLGFHVTDDLKCASFPAAFCLIFRSFPGLTVTDGGRYSFSFQVSDYYAVRVPRVTALLGDGQRFNDTIAPIVSFTPVGGSTVNSSFTVNTNFLFTLDAGETAITAEVSSLRDPLQGPATGSVR